LLRCREGFELVVAMFSTHKQMGSMSTYLPTHARCFPFGLNLSVGAFSSFGIGAAGVLFASSADPTGFLGGLDLRMGVFPGCLTWIGGHALGFLGMVRLTLQWLPSSSSSPSASRC
jgi:hypothetical protein